MAGQLLVTGRLAARRELHALIGPTPAFDSTYYAIGECGKQDKPGLPELDVCKLELRQGGALSVLMRGRTPGSTSDIGNPVVSPDGKWLVFQRSDSSSGDIGEGYGIYRYRLP